LIHGEETYDTEQTVKYLCDRPSVFWRFCK